jgi:hypothetical protein
MLNPATSAALDRFAPEAEYVDVSASDDAYHALLARLWADGEGIVNVEQDVEIHADVLPQFEACPEPWCSFPYGTPHPLRPSDPTWMASLWSAQAIGCVRWSADVLREHPDVLETIPPGSRAWPTLDLHICAELQRRGIAGPHRHGPPPVRHWHPPAWTQQEPGHGDPAPAKGRNCSDQSVNSR